MTVPVIEDINVIVAIGSLSVAILSLVASMVFSFISYRQSFAFKRVEIEREDVREIRDAASSFLHATTERLIANTQRSTIDDTISANEKNFNPNLNHEKTVDFIANRYLELRNSADTALAKQGFFYEKMRFLLSEQDSKRDELITTMRKMLDVQSSSDIEPSSFTSIANLVIAERSNRINVSLGRSK